MGSISVVKPDPVFDDPFGLKAVLQFMQFEVNETAGSCAGVGMALDAPLTSLFVLVFGYWLV